MRNLLVFMMFLGTSAHPAAPTATPAQQTVMFDGTLLRLVFEGDNPGEHIREYIPDGQKLQSWTRLASIREYAGLNDPMAVAGTLVRTLKAQNPDAPSSVIQNPDSGDVIVDFVTWPPDRAFAEFNVFRYSKKEGGLVAHQFAVRAYGDATKFFSELKTLRERLVQLMAKEGLQVK